MKKMLIALALILLLSSFAAAHADNVFFIRGLDTLPRLTKAEVDALPAPSAIIELTLNGEPFPYDSASNTYFIPQSPDTDFYNGSVRIDQQPGTAYYLGPGTDCGKAAALEQSYGFTVYGVSENGCAASRILFTSLPVIALSTANGEQPSGEAGRGVLRIFSVKNGALICEQAHIEINVRGNTSQRFPKKSYRVQIVNDWGEKRNFSLAGMRSDDDWILNPMYTDTSKIREKLAYELWASINSSGSRAASSRLEYVEVFLNGEYWGLYGLQERVDNKQVSGDKTADILYKIIANDPPAVEELLACESRTVCRAFEVQNGDEFPGEASALWKPAAAFMTTLESGKVDPSYKIDLANAADYGLWSMLTQAHDCHFKNQYLNCVRTGEDYSMYKIPWDLNHTFGDVWLSDSVETNYSGYTVGSLVMDDLFSCLLENSAPEFISLVQTRWAELRAGAITEEAILSRADELYSEIYAALNRDSIRWPACGMGDGNALNILDIEQYIKQTLPRVDAYVEALDAKEEGL